jgi:hypothetical protein
MITCKCPFCGHFLENLDTHKIHVQECAKILRKVPDDHSMECTGCQKKILKQEYEPMYLTYKLYLQNDLCGICKHTIQSIDHMSKCYTRNGPHGLCQACKQKDIDGIKKRIELLYARTKIDTGSRQPQTLRCPNCFSPSERVSGCDNVRCTVCDTCWHFSKQTFTNGNISDSELLELVGGEPFESTEFNTMYAGRVIRGSRAPEAPSCSSKHVPNVHIVHNTTEQEKPKECGICFVNTSPILLEPCKHWCCLDCIVKSGKQECPWCRSNVLLYLLQKQQGKL